MPLTTRGIAAQILGSIRLLRDESRFCTANDCKVSVNHLIRKFSEPVTREGAQVRKQSRAVANGATGDTLEDHAVPVIVIVEEFLKLPPSALELSEANVDRVVTFLKGSLVLVEITPKEDLALNARGLQRKMPEHWYAEPEFAKRGHLARYQAAEIELVDA